jgi:hypothetical protein
MKSISIILLALLVFSSCKKKETEATSATITFSEPSLDDTIAAYNQLHMEGTIEGNNTLEGYRVKLTNYSTGAEIYSKSYDTRAEAYNFHEHWTNNLADTTKVTVNVIVNLDKSGNTMNKTRNVVCVP